MSIAVFCGLVIFVLLAVMLLAGVPIAIALAVSSICAILPVLNLGASVLTGAQRIFSGISVFSLLAIPFFILAGNIMNKGGIAIRLINFAKLFTGSIPGALAHTNAVANMLFGAISGSGTAAVSAMGSIIGPIEEEEGYDRDFSAAALCRGCHGLRRHLHHKADHDTDYGIPAHLHGMDLHHCSHCRPADYGIQRHERSRYAAQRFQ